MGRNNKNAWVLIIIMLAGVVIGGFIGDYAGSLPYMGWLRYGPDSFGLTQPAVLNLGVLKLQFGFEVRFTIASIIGLAISIFAYRKM